MSANKYPEHEKLKAKEHEASIASSFIDFIAEQGWELAEFNDKDEQLWPIHKRPDNLFAAWVVRECRAVLNEQPTTSRAASSGVERGGE